MILRHQAAAAFALTVLLAGLVTPAHAAAKYKIHWLLGHPNLDYFEEAAAAFKQTVETKSHGDIQVEIVTAKDDHPDNPSVGDKGIAAKVESGEAEMGHSFADVLGGVDPSYLAFESPYLMRDYRHMEGVLDGAVGEQMLDGLRAHHMVGLSFTYSGGASGVATLDRPLRSAEDFKGLKVGVCADDAVEKAWLTSLGATPVEVGHAQETALAAAKDGKIDAVVVTWRNFARGLLDQKFRDMSMMGSSYLVSVTYVNDKFYAGLPQKYQKLLKDASVAAGRIERAKTIELNEYSKRQVVAKGVRATYLSAPAQAAFVAALAPAYAAIDKVVGKDLVESIRKAGDGPEPEVSTDHFASR